MEDWYLERLGHLHIRHHLNILLGEREKLTIGRQAGDRVVVVDMVCNGKTVSRKHCVLTYHNKCWSIEDLKSRNGVYINEIRIPENTPTILQEGDKLGIGAFEVLADPDFFVFNVLKNTVRDKVKNEGVIVEVPSAAYLEPQSQCDQLQEPVCRSHLLSNDSDEKSKNKIEQQNTQAEDSGKEKVVLTSNAISLESDDDVIILSSGDEETFSSHPRFKQEPLDSPIQHAQQEYPFFPNRSISFLDESEEEEDTMTEISRKVIDRHFLTPGLPDLVPKEPKRLWPKSSAAKYNKAKVTKKSRGDLFLQDLVGELSSSLPAVSIPNTFNVIGSSNDEPTSNSAGAKKKRKHEGKDEQAMTDSLEEAPSFKKQCVRVGLSKENHIRYQGRPRDEAQPLGWNNKWIPQNYCKTNDRTGGENLPVTSNERSGTISIRQKNSLMPPVPIKTPIHRVDRNALTNDILYRICNWRYDWIEEQKKQTIDVPPPLLNELNRENRTLPELSPLTLVSAYDSLESYCSIFTPLMLHEIWAILCKNMKNNQFECITPLIHPNPAFCDGFALLKCEALSQTIMSDLDLVTLTVQDSLHQKPPIKYFGVVRQVVNRKWLEKDLDQRLLETHQRSHYGLYCKITFVLWIKKSNVPKELDKLFVVTKMARLNTTVKQLILNAELASSPLCQVILHPFDYANVFKLDRADFKDANHTLLNPSQYGAVESIARTMVCSPDLEPKVALLQGPPGTGKSHVIVELITRMLYMHYEKSNKFPKILVCAPSNSAIDEIADRLARRRLNVVRIGITASMHPNVVKISLDELTKQFQQKIIATRDSPESGRLRCFKEELNNLRKTKKMLIDSIDVANKKGQPDEARLHGRKLEQLESQIEGVDRSYQECYKKHALYFNTEKERFAMKKGVISRADIICTTLNSCRSKEMENLFTEYYRGTRKQFLCCIIDEASQCTEPESLTPLALGISKLVLIGDPDQLPATVTSQVAAKKRFDQSLFNRFYSIRSNMEDNEGVMMLNTQYRMAPAICEWPSKYFYGGKLVTAGNLIRNGPCYDYRVLNVMDGLEQLSEQSFNNENEAALVAKIATLIVNSPSTLGKSVGVITFYRSQKQCIIKQMSKEDASKVKVNTVDSFQGRQKDIVIVSCVRARREENTSEDIGFVSSLQRINVAMTRAKESLIVCGNFKTLEINETWQNLASNARDRELIHDVTSEYSSDNLRHLIMRPMPNP